MSRGKTKDTLSFRRRPESSLEMGSDSISTLKLCLTPFLIAVTIIAFFFFPAAASAEIPGQLIPECNWRTETYGLGAFVELAQNILKLIWGIIGSLALVMFVWGGFLWLTARGEDEQVKKGWDTLINAVIGLVIILGSWVIINTVILAVTSPGQWTTANLFGNTSWSQLAGGERCVELAKHEPGFVPAGVQGGACCWSETRIVQAGDPPPTNPSDPPDFFVGSQGSVQKVDCKNKVNNSQRTFAEKFWCPGKQITACGRSGVKTGWTNRDSSCEDLISTPKPTSQIGPTPPPPQTGPTEPGAPSPEPGPPPSLPDADADTGEPAENSDRVVVPGTPSEAF